MSRGKKSGKSKGRSSSSKSRKTNNKRSRKKKRARSRVEEPEEEGFDWVSPICFDAKSISVVMRDALDTLDFKYDRTQSDKTYTSLMVLFPLPKSAYVFRFELKRPINLIIDFYDTKPSHAGILPYMEIHELNDRKFHALKALLDVFISKLSRPPWQFTIGQRLQHGLLLPEWSRAKKAWRKLGFQI